MKTILFALAIFICAAIPTQFAAAHVLIRDESKTKGAVLHIVPDDDPIAGEESSLYFDTQDKSSQTNGYEVKLTITDAKGKEQQVPTKISGSKATAKYTFPSQGVYDISIAVTVDGKDYLFKQAQRVSRGISSGDVIIPTYPWAQITLIGVTIGGVVLLIVANNRKREISRYSSI